MSLFPKSSDASPEPVPVTEPAASSAASPPASTDGAPADGAVADWRADRVAACANGTNPMVMVELTSGWAVIGDTQFVPGYSLLISRHTDAAMLSQLPREERLQFLADLDLLALAVERACIAKDPAFRRVNIEILGNTDAYVHAHVFPRYEWEGPNAALPVWSYRDTRWVDELHEYQPGHEPLREAITAELRLLAGLPVEPEGPLAQPGDLDLVGPSSTEPAPSSPAPAATDAEPATTG